MCEDRETEAPEPHRRRTGGSMVLMRCWLVVVVVVGIAACAALKSTPEQDQVYEQWKACRDEGPGVLLTDVTADGHFTLYGSNLKIQLIKRCLSDRYGYAA